MLTSHVDCYMTRFYCLPTSATWVTVRVAETHAAWFVVEAYCGTLTYKLHSPISDMYDVSIPWLFVCTKYIFYRVSDIFFWSLQVSWQTKYTLLRPRFKIVSKYRTCVTIVQSPVLLVEPLFDIQIIWSTRGIFLKSVRELSIRFPPNLIFR